MVEPVMLAETGLSVREHQDRTVANYLELRGRGPFIPVLQGWTLDDYLRCIDLYADAGVQLDREPLVGLGSVCRRENTAEIARLIGELAGAGLRLHGFGVKTGGLERYGHNLASADSLAWSYNARWEPPLAECSHRRCNNCLAYALRWRRTILAKVAAGERQRATQGVLFDPPPLARDSAR